MIAPYEATQRFLEFSRYMQQQFGLHPTLREKSPKLIQRKIDVGYRNLHRIIKGLNMAKKTKNKKFVWNGYVNINIPESHTDKIKQYLLDEKTIFQDANQAMSDLYTLKIYYDNERENYRASLTCYDESDDNYGKMIGAFAGDWYTAMGVVLYKHFTVSGEEWGATVVEVDVAFG